VTRLLFVCMGNICRSPLAEGIFLHLAGERGILDRYRVDSAGIGDWHVGHAPDPRSQAVARKNGFSLNCVARQVVTPDDFETFDWLLAMDAQNFRDLYSLSPAEHQGKIRLIRHFDPEAGKNAEVPDPYYGGPRGFDHVFDMLLRSCRGLLDALEQGGEGSRR
jgi:protein-tyrosine phosphatase